MLIREAFSSLLPIILVLNILLLLTGVTGLFDIFGVSEISGNTVNQLNYFLLPLFLNLSLTILLARQKGLDLIGTIVISLVCYLRISGFLEINPASEINSSSEVLTRTGSILTCIPATLIAVHLVSWFGKRSQFQWVKRNTDISPHLRNTLNLLMPGCLTLLCCELFGAAVRAIFNPQIMAQVAGMLPRFSEIGQLNGLLLYKIISLFTWFLGIHGEYSAEGLFYFLNDGPAGDILGIDLKILHDVFMNIGGTGSTFIIPFILLLSHETHRFHSLAKLSLAFSFFNVNEILLFGLPIILNPQLLIPFITVPFVNLLITLIGLETGLFYISPEPIHWMTPPLLNAYMVSGGSWTAVSTQIICLAIDGMIYYPFLLQVHRRYQSPVHLKALLRVDAYHFLREELQKQEEKSYYRRQKEQLNRLNDLQKTLNQLKGGKFLLYFQPKVDAHNNAIVGIEALLRFQDKNKTIHTPSFLDVIYDHGLSKAIDKKVFGMAIDQILHWREAGYVVPPISINFDKDFLLDPVAINNFLKVTAKCKVHCCIEITEHTYTVELDALAAVVKKVRAAGHRVSIDDFGTGYSSLTSLLSTQADEVKLDRKLITTPRGEHKRGLILLESSVKLCHDLGFTVVAEGVEDIGQLGRVRRYGVDYIQGFLTGKPMNGKQICKLFQRNKIPAQIPAKAIESPYSDRSQYQS